MAAIRPIMLAGPMLRQRRSRASGCVLVGAWMVGEKAASLVPVDVLAASSRAAIKRARAIVCFIPARSTRIGKRSSSRIPGPPIEPSTCSSQAAPTYFSGAISVYSVGERLTAIKKGYNEPRLPRELRKGPQPHRFRTLVETICISIIAVQTRVARLMGLSLSL